MVALKGGEQLACRRHRAVDNIVGQEYGERLISDDISGGQDGMPQSQSFSLAHVADAGHAADFVEAVAALKLAPKQQAGLELGAGIEVVLQAVLAGRGDHDDLADARRGDLFHGIVN